MVGMSSYSWAEFGPLFLWVYAGVGLDADYKVPILQYIRDFRLLPYPVCLGPVHDFFSNAEIVGRGYRRGVLVESGGGMFEREAQSRP